MDATTIDAYDRLGADFARRYRSAQRVPTERFERAFAHCRKVLEIGAGSGIDLARLLDAGFDAVGIEPSTTLRDEAAEHFPHLRGRLHDGALPFPDPLTENWRGGFGGVFCSAVLMHLRPDDQERALEDIATLLQPGGRLLLTVSATRDGLDGQRRDEFGRFYAELPPERIERLCSQAGLRVMHVWHDDDQWHRRGLEWTTYLSEKAHTARPA